MIKTRKKLLSLLLAMFFAPALSHALPVVVIDPGHGGHDLGTKYGGIFEKNLAFETSVMVADFLRRKNLHVVMTRYSDVFIELNNRPRVADSYKKAIFISIHYNESNSNAGGFETYYYGSRQSKVLAVAIQSNLAHYNRRVSDRKVKTRSFRVLRKAKCPAALVECGFLSSRNDRRYITRGGMDDIAESIARGILRYIYDHND